MATCLYQSTNRKLIIIYNTTKGIPTVNNDGSIKIKPANVVSSPSPYIEISLMETYP